MATPHIKAENGQIAKTVLMPGDPLRAKFIAETFLENPVQFNTVRNMFGYTGTYKGKEISVMGSGMGMPSIGIYSYELYTQFGVDNIIRIGSAGAYTADLHVYDCIIANSAYSESSYAKTQNGYDEDKTYPSESLNAKLKEKAKKLEIVLHDTCVHSSDVFYRSNLDYMKEVVEVHECKVVEMESFALFHNATVCGKNAACLLTVSDSFVLDEMTTAEERQNSFTNMMKIALEAA
jgi:purine-nucleoside phosphorylase